MRSEGRIVLTFITGILVALILILVAFAVKQARGHYFYRALARLAEAAGEEQEPAKVGQQLLAVMAAAVHATAGLLYCQKDGLDKPRLLAAYGLNQGQLSKAAGLNLPERFLAQAHPVCSVAIVQESQATDGFLAGYAGMLVMRMAVSAKLVGVAVMLRSAGRFGRQETGLLSRFAHHAGITLNNAQLYLVSKSAAEENARLYLNLSKLYRLATVDNLTGLHNRGYMQQRLKEEIKKAWRFQQPLALIAIDLDRLDQVNVAHGQKTGDEILRETAAIVRRTAREYDVICRHGGDEFLLILPQTGLDGAQALAERLRGEIGEHAFPQGIRPTCSVGVTGMAPTGVPSLARQRAQNGFVDRAFASLLALVDEALSHAKDGGRDRVEVAGAVDPSGLKDEK